MNDKIKVSDLIAEALEQLDIRHAFGMVGAGNVHLFEAIAKRGFTEIVCILYSLCLFTLPFGFDISIA